MKTTRTSSKKSTAKVAADVQQNTPAVVILQWLTYAFWGWAALAMTILSSIVASFVISGQSQGVEPLAYFIGAVVVILPIALVCDLIFSKNERNHKAGVALVIMVIHTVLYALLAVAGLASVVFALISMLLPTADTTWPVVWLLTSLVATVSYALVLLRIIYPRVGTKLRLLVRTLLVLLALTAVVWAIAGPITQSIVRRDDNYTQAAAFSTTGLISGYAYQEGTLPASLDAVQAYVDEGYYVDNESQLAIEQSIANETITYKPNIQKPTEDATGKTFYYEICVVYQYDDPVRQEGSKDFYLDYTTSSERDSAMPVLNGTSDKAGEHCYELYVTVPDDNGVIEPAKR